MRQKELAGFSAHILSRWHTIRAPLLVLVVFMRVFMLHSAYIFLPIQEQFSLDSIVLIGRTFGINILP